MSSFTPTQFTMEPPDRPEHLAAAVMQSLSRQLPKPQPWGPIKTLILGGVSFGMLPLLSWPKCFGAYVVAEQQQFWHLVEWLRIRTGSPQAAELKQSVRNTGARITAWMIPLILLAWIVLVFIPLFVAPSFHIQDLLLATYGHSQWTRFSRSWSTGPYLYFYHTWTLCLCFAYAFHWLHVREHANDVARMVEKINALLARENVERVSTRSPGIGLRPMWLVVGFIGAAFGAWWAIPAAMAGGMQAKYIYRTSPYTRTQLGQRVRQLLLSNRPPINVQVPVQFRLACPNPLCHAILPHAVTYCPRCGMRIAAAVDKLA
jgi:hypothetical protein